ncbi:MAG: hypothetical protein ACPG4K_10575, partial [Haloferula sp.]
MLWRSLLACSTLQADQFPTPTNNQEVGRSPLTKPSELVDMMSLPEGFEASVFAAEPHIRNPIAM